MRRHSNGEAQTKEGIRVLANLKKKKRKKILEKLMCVFLYNPKIEICDVFVLKIIFYLFIYFF